MNCYNVPETIVILDADGVPWNKSVTSEGSKTVRTFYSPDMRYDDFLDERDNKTVVDQLVFPVTEENVTLEQGVTKFFPSLLFEYESPKTESFSVSRVHFLSNGLFVSCPFACRIVIERSVQFGPWVTVGRKIVSGEDYLACSDYFAVELFKNQLVNVRWRVGFLTQGAVGLVFGDPVSSFSLYYENNNAESTL